MFQPHLHAGALTGITGGGTPIELEPVNNSLPASDRVGNTVENTARQTWWGFGWGLGIPSENILNNVKAYTSQLFTELGTTVLRFNSPSDAQHDPDRQADRGRGRASRRRHGGRHRLLGAEPPRAGQRR